MPASSFVCQRPRAPHGTQGMVWASTSQAAQTPHHSPLRHMEKWMWPQLVGAPEGL